MCMRWSRPDRAPSRSPGSTISARGIPTWRPPCGALILPPDTSPVASSRDLPPGGQARHSADPGGALAWRPSQAEPPESGHQRGPSPKPVSRGAVPTQYVLPVRQSWDQHHVHADSSERPAGSHTLSSDVKLSPPNAFGSSVVLSERETPNHRTLERPNAFSPPEWCPGVSRVESSSTGTPGVPARYSGSCAESLAGSGCRRPA